MQSIVLMTTQKNGFHILLHSGTEIIMALVLVSCKSGIIPIHPAFSTVSLQSKVSHINLPDVGTCLNLLANMYQDLHQDI
jgi:hypothetical protein